MLQETGKARRSIKSAERVLDLLETIGSSSDGMTFTDLGAALGIPKSSLHALLNVLSSRGYIETDLDSRRFTLGVRVWETGLAYHRHHGLLKEARAVMEAIVGRINETVQLAKLAGSENIYLEKVDSTHPLRLQSEVGMRLSAHATGIGKALLAQLDAADLRERYPKESLQRFSPNTIVTFEALLNELAHIRRRGFAVDNEEYTPGIFCLAVPVYQGGTRAMTALSVSVPTSRARRSELPGILSALAGGSVEIAQRVGGSCPDEVLKSLVEPGVAAARIEEMLSSGRYPVSFG